MRATVFTDMALARQAGRFVWLSIDTEKAVNAPFKQRYGVSAWPTYFVLDPSQEKVALRWVGGATVPQLLKIFDDGERAVGKPATSLSSRDQALARADSLYGESKWAEAATAYSEALAKAPRSWKPWSRATESLLFAQYGSRQWEACAVTARDAYPVVRGTPSAANVAASGLGCALEMDSGSKDRGALISALQAACREVLADTKLRVAADDLSGVYISLLSARQDAKDEEGSRKVASEWAAFLEKEAAKAPTPDARAIFDSHRVSAYLELGQPERALPMLEASERDFPDDYNPPARLSIALNALGRWDEALAASDRALARIEGPRRLTVLRTRADIYAKKGDAAAARRTVEESLRYARALPEGQRSDRAIASLEKKLESFEPKAP